MNDGKLEGKAVVPASIVNATLAPSMHVADRTCQHAA
jgi:hypothetical protein